MRMVCTRAPDFPPRAVFAQKASRTTDFLRWTADFVIDCTRKLVYCEWIAQEVLILRTDCKRMVLRLCVNVVCVVVISVFVVVLDSCDGYV